MTKEQTPLPPLMSDEEINDPKLVIPLGAKMIRDIYEADRQRTREVVQRLVNALAENKELSLSQLLAFFPCQAICHPIDPLNDDHSR